MFVTLRISMILKNEIPHKPPKLSPWGDVWRVQLHLIYEGVSDGFSYNKGEVLIDLCLLFLVAYRF